MSSTLRSKSKPAWYHIDKGALAVSNALDNAVAKILANDLARKSAVGMKAFCYNSEAKYHPGLQHTASRDVGDFKKGQVHVQAGDPQKFFEASYFDIFQKYPLQVSSDDVVQAWRTNPMQFWQNQLNFAVWCATTGCGVSVEDHLTNDDEFLRSVYRFHAYYQIRLILEDMQAPLPFDDTWNAVNNSYDRKGYEKICTEFNISPNFDWRVHGHNQGLGRVYTYWTNTGYTVFRDGEWRGNMSFTEKTTAWLFHVDFIKQDAAGADKAWKSFILNISNGLTRPGVERLDDSIQTYVWSVLTAQVQIRTNIIGTGAAFRAQTQFQENVETSITSPMDLEAAIDRYQDVVQNASSEINFFFGEGLVMAPGDLLLRIGKIVGYNNNIIIATSAQRLGLNKGLNKGVSPLATPSSVAPPDAANDTGEKGLFIPMGADSEATTGQTAAKPTPATTTAADKADHEAHEDEKTALIVGSIVIGLGLFWFLR